MCDEIIHDVFGNGWRIPVIYIVVYPIFVFLIGFTGDVFIVTADHYDIWSAFVQVEIADISRKTFVDCQNIL